MRILILSNFYPPARSGGYTQWCYEVAEQLEARGHSIGVLTSRYEREKAPAGEEHIYRLLHLEGDLEYYRPIYFFRKWPKEYRENLAFLEQVVRTFSPNLIFVWGMWALSHALPALAEQMLPGRVVYYLSDYWPMTQDMHTAYWEAQPNHWQMRLPKRMLRLAAGRVLARKRHAPLRFEQAMCVSSAVKRRLVAAGLPLEEARVVHGGTDVARFPYAVNGRFQKLPLKLLYAGQLVDHKGVHTAVEAMMKLASGPGPVQAHLTIMGAGHPDYELRLRRMVESAGLAEFVQFRAPVTRPEMAAVLGEYDVLVFPSIYEEPLARMTQEAMAANMVVIGTTTGGTSEILRNGENGLTFPAGDAGALARQIERLLLEPGLAGQLSMAGRKAILGYFNLERMVEEIEAYLQLVVGNLSLSGEIPLEQSPT